MLAQYEYKHIIIVHGIGDQAPNETALGFMNEFIRALPKDGKRKLAVGNLIESVDGKRFQPANIVFEDTSDGGARKVIIIGFSEVYWQPVTDKYLADNNNRSPVPIFTWARSVSTRLLDPGYRMAQWRATIDNLETMLKLLGRLATISKKSKLFVAITERFLGDVQMYAESDQIRMEINKKFFHVLSRVGEFKNSGIETIRRYENRSDFLGFADEHIRIYVIAHSEGTVVAYNSLVQAAMVGEGRDAHRNDPEFDRAEKALTDSEGEGGVVARTQFNWLAHIAGLVTLGSPLDKHYLIWRTRFRKHRLKTYRAEKKIPWLNFYDFNDPVAYDLTELHPQETESSGPTDAQRMFDTKEHGDKRDNDFGFKRYPIPGKAHVDYWKDKAIHQRIIQMMGLAIDRVEPLSSGWWVWWQPLFAWLSYLLVRGLTIFVGLLLVNRLLHTVPLEPVLGWGPLQSTHAFLTSQPFGQDWAWLNPMVWLLVPILGVKLLVEAEQGLVLGKNLSPWLRWILIAAWLVAALVIGVYIKPNEGDASISDVVGYVIGLFATVTVWKLHTTVHRGLIQLWRKTKAL